MLGIPVVAGMFGVLLPAFGYFPIVGRFDLGWDVFEALVDHPAVPRAAWLSFKVGLCATLISVFVTVWLTSTLSGGRVWRIMTGLLGPFLALPHAAAAFGIAFLIAPSGLLMRLMSPWMTGFDRPPDWLIIQDPAGWSMVAALVLKEVPFLLLLTLAALPSLRADRFLPVAVSMGYTRSSAFVLTIWPRLYPQIRLGVYLVLAYSMSVVDVAQIIGPTTPPTLSVLVVKWMNDPDLTKRMLGAAGAVLQLGLVGAAMVLWWCGEKLTAALYRIVIQRGFRMPFVSGTKAPAATAAVVLVSALLGGIAVIVIWSFAGFWGFPDALPDAMTFRNWERHLDGVLSASVTTAVIGIISVCFALILTIWMFETGRVVPKWLLYLPLIVPQISFLPGIQILALQTGLTQGFIPVLLAHLVFVLPYFVLTLSGAYAAWDRGYAHTAGALGATGLRTLFVVKLPMLIGPILIAAAIAIAVSVGQYLPTLLLGGGRIETLTTEAVTLASGGDRRAIGVFAVAQVFASIVPYLLAICVPLVLWRNRKGMTGA